MTPFFFKVDESKYTYSFLAFFTSVDVKSIAPVNNDSV